MKQMKEINIKEIKEEVVKILNKLRYVIEFLLMLITITNIYKFITTIEYVGYVSVKSIIVLYISGILAITSLIYNCIKDKDKIENIFLNFAIPVGLLYIVFMIPIYTPDADAHIWKAYEVSEGIFYTPVDENGNALTTVPAILPEINRYTVSEYNVMNNLMQNPEAYNYENATEVDSPAKLYSTVFYIFYAIGFAISRFLGLNMFTAFFLARIINYIVVLAVQYIAIKKIPFGKLLLAIYFLMPMAIHQSTAISMDSIMNALMMLFISYTLNLSLKKDKLKIKEVITFLVLTGFIGLSKLTYIPLIGIGLILAKHRKELNKKQKVLLGILTVIICLCSVLVMNAMTKGYTNASAEEYLTETGVNSEEQLKLMISNPANYLKVLYNDFRVHIDFYLLSCIGEYMGWLTITFPATYVILYVIILFLSIFLEKNEHVLDKMDKIWMLILTIIIYLLIVTALYLEWTKVGAMTIAGVQGRYFLPIFILPLLCLSQKNNYIKMKNVNIIIPLLAAIVNLLFIMQIIRFFL